MNDSYKIWKPEHDGHAPPNWREGMKWAAYCDSDGIPHWRRGFGYCVPTEALNSPNDDASGDVDTWKRDDALNELARRGWEYSFADLVDVLRKLPPETLQKHGITIAPGKDWATELWADLMETADMKIWVRDIRKGKLRDYDQAAIELLRTRFEQMKGEG